MEKGKPKLEMMVRFEFEDAVQQKPVMQGLVGLGWTPPGQGLDSVLEEAEALARLIYGHTSVLEEAPATATQLQQFLRQVTQDLYLAGVRLDEYGALPKFMGADLPVNAIESIAAQLADAASEIRSYAPERTITLMMRAAGKFNDRHGKPSQYPGLMLSDSQQPGAVSYPIHFDLPCPSTEPPKTYAATISQVLSMAADIADQTRPLSGTDIRGLVQVVCDELINPGRPGNTTTY
ncbi:hypothetical protein [Alloalcanivorax xenomutans]|uniref:hypothetical protein n=1 Tax=Alloalcanivorax xenomutans TaxID=1094342 RepID=UPI001F2B79F4|nr:hypothetical protein [Alloalcanivorax xenomutans]MCE7521939.1 hypothetical protein [Alloalcanivorax xenomutans]